MESLGLFPGGLFSVAVGCSEFIGGLCLLIGFLVRPTVLLLSAVMLGAIFSVHWQYGLFVANNGYGFALALLAICVSLGISGGGRWSVDNLFYNQVKDD
jgi:putative oxidoreductase